MNNTDQETVLRAIEDARRILGEYNAPLPARRYAYSALVASRSSIELRSSTLSIE